MSMRAITNNQYKGVSDLYRKFDAKVTGYYVTSRDTYGKATRKEVIRMYLYKKMEILLFAMLVTLLTGCGGGGGSSTASAGTTGTHLSQTTGTPVLSSKAVQTGQVKDSETGEGLANVKVSIGSQTATTDTDGFYTLSDLTETEEAVVNFEKEGYLLGSTKIQIKELSGDNTPSTNYLEYAIDAYDYEWNYDSQESASGSHIDIPDSVYTDTEGNLYTGTVTASLEFRDVTTNEGKALFTGSFEGININGELVPFVSYGFISLSFKDANGNALKLTSDSGATLTFDAVPSLEEQNIIPLWYYDYEQGLWIEEGYAELQADNTYKGDISHSGTWSLNKPIETDPGIYRGRILNEDGSPISDVRLQAIGNNWISNDLSTDEDGVFEIVVIPGEDFKLKAYHYEDKYGAESGTISAVSSGEIVEI